MGQAKKSPLQNLSGSNKPMFKLHKKDFSDNIEPGH